jgi:oxygen-independent coproporphyrinogen III oxidase
MKPEDIYKKGLLFHHYANTAYPLTPGSFKQYRINNQEEILSYLQKELSGLNELSLYVHIPFCKQRCKFCEYTVLENTDSETENLYISLLLKEIAMYAALLKGKKVVGYDMGGGTPSKLSMEHLKTIMDALLRQFDFDPKTVFSIETTPVIAAHEPEKIKAIYDLGYRRISMGIQTISEKLLNDLGREGAVSIYEQGVHNVREAGFKQLNVDLMYGFLHQTDEDFENTLRYAIALKPEYITLYRNRYKGTKIESESGGVSLYKIIRQYRLAFDILNENGYVGNPGKNTFSKIKSDYGTSDYLTKRVIEGTSYVGMGLGAQSFGLNYLAYNEGAASKKLDAYRKKVETGQFPIQDIYRLPIEESIGKMVSVAFYFGFVDLGAFQKRFGISFTDHFSAEVSFVLENALMEMQGNRIALTKRGADYINGIIPLFFSERSKAELIELADNSAKVSDGENEFLSAYNFEEFTKPSVTVDSVVFALDLEKDPKVLLIKRGEHPFMNCWALPGGFVRPGETIDAAAVRELAEETGITNVPLSMLKVFSDPGRDPRGWVISCAYSAIIPAEGNLRYGEDSIDAQWFSVSELENEKIAFDHAAIIKSAAENHNIL